MFAYYNEIDPFAAQWLRNLIKAGHVPDGEVDERSIVDVDAADLRQFRQCHFFAGIGGWAYAARLAGWPDDRELWTGSLPCQPYSVAGLGLGNADPRDLWSHQLRLIAACRPAVWMGEQVAAAIGKGWLDRLCDGLEAIDYACGATVIQACAVGAPHRRERLWAVAHSLGNQQSREESCGRAAGRVGGVIEPVSWDEPWQGALSRLRVLDDGAPRCVAGTDAARNAIVPQVAAEVIAAYMECHPL